MAEEPYLIDTNVLVDFLKGKEPAVTFLNELEGPPLISSLTVAELFAGVRGKKEQSILEQFVQSFKIVHVDTEIAKKGGLYKNQYSKSHGVGLADAIIAASCTKTKSRLVSLNKKHFPMLRRVIVPY